MSLPFTGQCVLLTGAGGSIGAALVKEIVPHRPRSLVLLDHSEGNLHQLNFELSCLPDASFHRKRVVRLAPLLVRKPAPAFPGSLRKPWDHAR